jgi:hypothetical protein
MTLWITEVTLFIMGKTERIDEIMNKGDIYLVKPDSNCFGGNERPAIILDNDELQLLTTQKKIGYNQITVDNKVYYIIPDHFKITAVLFIRKIGRVG